MGNILVTGAAGQVGSELRVAAGDDRRFIFTDRERLDITDSEALEAFIAAEGIETIINCAAYTAVDRAEEEPEVADRINHLAVVSMAQIAKERGIGLIHISTDYVFDGRGYKPYREEDATAPTGVYGKTKLAGEQAILEIAPPRSVIIRTAWVYSSFGNNFVKTMLRLGKERKSLGVIFDQVGTPTYARDLAEAILEMLPQIDNEKPQIYHYTNEGVLSWYDFAREIMRMAKLPAKVDPIETEAYPTPATRPHFSLLNKRRIKERFGLEIPYWKESLDNCLREMGERR